MGLPHMYDRSAFFPQQDVNFCFIINFINLGEQQIFGGDCIFAGEPQSIESSLPRAVLIGGGPWPLCAMTCGHLVTGTNHGYITGKDWEMEVHTGV
mmetsp:Transcript_34208/g.69972  ORF Transcript_34208/g.69972 Transcript_34208/m.69972 type:complete len:96 (-) Transcript_34208:3201-3488(-)